MGRLLALDYGTKRTGIAISDTLKIIANGLTTVPTHYSYFIELFEIVSRKRRCRVHCCGAAKANE